MRNLRVRPGTSIHFWRGINRATTQLAARCTRRLGRHEMAASGISYREVLQRTNIAPYDTRPVSF